MIMFCLAVVLGAMILVVHIGNRGIAKGWKAVIMAAIISLFINVAGHFAWHLIGKVQIGHLSGNFILMIVVPAIVAAWYQLRPEWMDKHKRQLTWGLLGYIVFLMSGLLAKGAF